MPGHRIPGTGEGGGRGTGGRCTRTAGRCRISRARIASRPAVACSSGMRRSSPSTTIPGLPTTSRTALPTQLTMYANHAANNPFEMNTTALYAQDQWTVRSPDAARRDSLRADRQLLPGEHFRRGSFPPGCADLPGAGCRRRPEGHRPAVRRGVRPVWQRQDVAQVQHGTVSDRRQLVRRVRLAPAAGEPRRHHAPPAIGTISPSRPATRGEATTHPTAI